jgi:ribosome-associated protein YbcJ (S4-like RNA binding protein)
MVVYTQSRIRKCGPHYACTQRCCVCFKGAPFVFLSHPMMFIIIQVTKFKAQAVAPPNLIALLKSEKIVKTGFTVTSHLKRISAMWHLQELYHQLSRRNADHIIELGSLAKLKGVVSSNSQIKPALLIGAVLNCSLP